MVWGESLEIGLMYGYKYEGYIHKHCFKKRFEVMFVALLETFQVFKTWKVCPGILKQSMALQLWDLLNLQPSVLMNE